MERLKDENVELCRFFIVINKFLNNFKKQRAESEELKKIKMKELKVKKT